MLINHNLEYTKLGLETIMKFANALLARLGLTPKVDAPDAFDLRLRKIERREAAYAAQQRLFKNQSSQQAA